MLLLLKFEKPNFNVFAQLHESSRCGYLDLHSGGLSDGVSDNLGGGQVLPG